MWSRVPLLRLIIPFIAGIMLSVNLAGCYGPAGSHMLMFTSAAVALSALMFPYLYGYRTRWLHGLMVILMMFSCGFAFAERKKQNRASADASLPEGKRVYLAVVKESFEMRQRSCKGLLRLYAVADSTGWKHCDALLMVYTQPDSTLPDVTTGSVMALNAFPSAVDPPANPAEFDYRHYLAGKGIYHDVFLKTGEWLITVSRQPSDIRGHASRLRDALLSKLMRSGITDGGLGVAAAMLLGDNAYLGSDVRDAYARAGAMHILCVSGLHVGVVFLVMSALLAFLKRIPGGKLLYPMLLVIMIWFYALLTGLAPPVARASSMLSFLIIGKALSRHSNVYNTLAAAALLTLMTDPYAVFGAGFQLSYAAVLGIVTLQRPLYNLLYFRYRIPDRIWAITAVSIAAQLGTLPLALYYFHQYPVYSLLTNLIVIPLSSLIIYAGFLLFFIPSMTWASEASAWLLKTLLFFLDRGVTFVEGLPGAAISGINVDANMALILFLMIALLSAYLVFRQKTALMLGLTAMLAFSGYRLARHHRLLLQELVLVYSISGHTACDIIKGRSHTFIADSVLLFSPGKMDYSIRPFWMERGLDDPDTVVLGMRERHLHAAGLIKSSGIELRMAFWQGAFPHCHPPAGKLMLDLLVLRGDCPFGMETVFTWFDPRWVILDSSVPPWVKAPEGDERFRVVREKGAFVVTADCLPFDGQ